MHASLLTRTIHMTIPNHSRAPADGTAHTGNSKRYLATGEEWLRAERGLLVSEGGIVPLVGLSHSGTAKAKHKELLKFIMDPEPDVHVSENGESEARNGNVSGRIEAFNCLAGGNNFADVIQAKRGHFGDVPASKMTELMKLGNLEGPTLSGTVASELNGSKTIEPPIKDVQMESNKDKRKDTNGDGDMSNSSSDSEDEDRGPTKEECILQFKEGCREFLEKLDVREGMIVKLRSYFALSPSDLAIDGVG
ncbi:hypothetical protein PHJA_000582600 [Phtheirospermum japonicum]|uniref:Uncharacterized protein n=1 Tax=Phtheirospermum japonicum TaxID=374723 RepID=A0A830BH00_9LAMI|nr:hypothetical protein PHJA_000582600 [Phtheirospermum japonicum]